MNINNSNIVLNLSTLKVVQKALTAWVQGDFAGIDHKEGLCDNLKNKVSFFDKVDLYKYLRVKAADWEYFSGSTLCPVPHPFKSPENAYILPSYHGSLWEVRGGEFKGHKAYINARLNLCAFILTQVNEDIIKGVYYE